MLSSTFFGGLKASRRWKLKKKLLVSKILSQTNWVLYFLKYFTKGFVADKVLGISIFPSCTPIRGIYRKLLLNTKIRSTMLCLSCFELYSRWVPRILTLNWNPGLFKQSRLESAVLLSSVNKGLVNGHLPNSWWLITVWNITRFAISCVRTVTRATKGSLCVCTWSKWAVAVVSTAGALVNVYKKGAM